MKVVSCRPAWVKTSNRFTNLFAQAVQDAGWDVEQNPRDFATRVREPGPPVADLSRYEWGPIGEAIGDFFDPLSQKAELSRSRQFEPGRARS